MLDDEWEYGFAAPIPGLMYVTTNAMLAETMHNARPEIPLYRRPRTPWTEETGKVNPDDAV